MCTFLRDHATGEGVRRQTKANRRCAASLEGIYFYNFTTPEFNVNVCQLPFWAGTVYFAWKSFKTDKTSNWILFGMFAALGFISKYLFLYLLVSIKLFFIYRK